MKTLEHQLAEYGNRQRELHGPISAEELKLRLGDVNQTAPVQPLRPMPQPARFRRPQGWLVAMGAAAAIFVLVGATALLFRTTASEAPAAPVATVPPIDDVSSLSWFRVPDDVAVFGGPTDQAELFGVITGGPGLVAVGLVGSTYTGDAAVWTSPDGVTWSRVLHDEAVFGHQDGGVIKMKSVTRAGSQLVAVGDQNLCCSYNLAAAAWTSPDGITWSRVPHNGAVFDRAGMNSVTAGGPGLVAVGFEILDFLDGEHVIAVAWTSPDGVTWSRVPHNEAVFDRAEMYSVTAGGPGLVAVGASYPHDHPSAAVVWTSTDGITWSRVPHDEAAFDRAGMKSVTTGGPGLVAVGWSDQDEHTVAVVWTSTDGITWSRVAHDEAAFDRAEMESVTAGDSGLVAVGRSSQDEHTVAVVWTSADGITWSRVPHDETVFGDLRYQEMFDVITGGPGFVAVGSANRNDGDFADGVVWVAATKGGH